MFQIQASARMSYLHTDTCTLCRLLRCKLFYIQNWTLKNDNFHRCQWSDTDTNLSVHVSRYNLLFYFRHWFQSVLVTSIMGKCRIFMLFFCFRHLTFSQVVMLNVQSSAVSFQILIPVRISQLKPKSDLKWSGLDPKMVCFLVHFFKIISGLC